MSTDPTASTKRIPPARDEEDDTMEFAEPVAGDSPKSSKRPGLKAVLAAGGVASALACTARYRRHRAVKKGSR